MLFRSRVAMALQAACLTEVVDSLPQGLSTRIGERGTRLSGGQCQRLALARALYRSSEMLLLDEATSHQDAATERRIVEGLLHRTHGDTPPTMLMIGHHLPCPELFDRIVIIEEGRVTGDDHHRARSGQRRTELAPVRHRNGHRTGLPAG